MSTQSWMWVTLAMPTRSKECWCKIYSQRVTQNTAERQLWLHWASAMSTHALPDSKCMKHIARMVLILLEELGLMILSRQQHQLPQSKEAHVMKARHLHFLALKWVPIIVPLWPSDLKRRNSSRRRNSSERKTGEKWPPVRQLAPPNWTCSS